MNKLTVVVGGQFGSEGKGAVAAHLHRTQRYGWAVRVAGPNAGHTVVDSKGLRWPLRQIPVAAVADPDCALYIAPGSEVDLNVLAGEVRGLEDAGIKVKHRLFVSPEATVIHDGYAMMEKLLVERSGSTGKGIGAARAARLMRAAQRYGDLPKSQLPVSLHGVQINNQALMANGPVLIEGTQGFGLGLHAGWYPHCTSSDCRAVDFCAMAGISPWDWDLRVVVCLRPYPIRIAGNSGPMHQETTWEALGLPVEYTTVTKKPRRVGQWDPALARRAVAANGRSRCVIAFTMADQVVPEVAGLSGSAVRHRDVLARWVGRIEADTGSDVRYVGTGPSTMLEV